MDGAQRMSHILQDNCGRGATRETAHCCDAISKCGFPTIQASSCARHPLKALTFPALTVLAHGSPLPTFPSQQNSPVQMYPQACVD